MHRLVYVFVAFFLIVGCNKSNDVTRSFYYWKTSFTLSNPEEKLLSDLVVKKLYVHYFDVNYIDEKKAIFPVGKITFDKEVKRETSVVPVVYIVNEVFKQTHISNIDSLARNVSTLMNSISISNSIHPKEIQFDCDWTDATQEKYFLFLEDIRKLYEKSIQISATIRLHQVKYKRRTGIPPVDRGMLMFYNMGQLNPYGPLNSIYDESIAESYVSYINTYPLPLDYALPVFSWIVWSRNGKNIGLINSVSEKEILRSDNFNRIGKHLFVVKQGLFLGGKYLLKGDNIFIEEVSPELTNVAISQLLPEINSSKFTVAFYHLDASLFKNYDQQKLESLFSRFN